LKWQAVGQAAEPGNPMGDYVMLQYLSGKQGKALTPYAPKALRKLLFPKGQPWLGFRPAFLMVFAVVMSGGLWWWWDPIHPLFAILFLVFLSVQIWLHIKMYDVLLPLAGVVTLVLVLAGINHLTFGFMESWGWVCESTAGPLKQNTSPEVTLQTKSLCQASGIELIKGKQYRLTMTINDGWKDNEIPADTTGVNPDQGALALYLVQSHGSNR
jgi:hypothetical protein